MELALVPINEQDELPTGHEIINGVLVGKAMSSAGHAFIQLALGRALGPYEDTWFFGSEAEVMFERGQRFLPDLAGWHSDREPGFDECPTTIVPDWVCQILSRSTAYRDRGTKQRTFHRARVPHYWLIDPSKRALIAMRWTRSDYEVIVTAEGPGCVRVPPFEDVVLDLGKLFRIKRGA